ncbi:hypothetical protein HYPSUDRAFT_207258 [Hypholoma sublateritium FD-334 SS-4]|uniref:Uncharacterized protein n=1 Tax=Hypholoma sublateritium (strain FD-334 SS-4) TaxID=945553 RepID=A0A0D2LZA7_HYPSF|nr:hypothetical protein HYPSUDRAFT_207258 [Hypholoma sublateritium FD-334 SS-4]
MDSVDGSPYITNFDLVPPSPTRSVHHDYDAPFDGPPVTSPPFAPPHTPSYNGSYYNSPFSQHSELSFTGDELDYELLQGIAHMQDIDYEPSDYDPAHPASGGLLMFAGDGGDYPSATLDGVASPPLGGGLTADIAHRGSPFDRSTPSDNGDDAAHPPFAPSAGAPYPHPYSPDAPGRHSRASSVASHSPSPGPAYPHHHTASGGQQQRFSPSPSPQPSPHIAPFPPAGLAHAHAPPQPSPRMAVAAQFGSMSVHTPSWPAAALPPPHEGPQKAQSPPRLRIADEQGAEYPARPDVPLINAPDEQDDLMGGGGPQFHIVPATPVSGGAGERMPFQQTLATLAQVFFRRWAARRFGFAFGAYTASGVVIVCDRDNVRSDNQCAAAPLSFGGRWDQGLGFRMRACLRIAYSG